MSLCPNFPFFIRINDLLLTYLSTSAMTLFPNEVPLWGTECENFNIWLLMGHNPTDIKLAAKIKYSDRIYKNEDKSTPKLAPCTAVIWHPFPILFPSQDGLNVFLDLAEITESSLKALQPLSFLGSLEKPLWCVLLSESLGNMSLLIADCWNLDFYLIFICPHWRTWYGISAFLHHSKKTNLVAEMCVQFSALWNCF